MLNDLRYALRMLLHAKSWTAIVVVSLALGIGANTALFSAVNSLLLRKLPVKDPDGLVRFGWAGRNDMVTNQSGYGYRAKDAEGRDVRASFSYPMFQQFLAGNQTMEALLACAPFGRVNVVVNGQADLASSFITTGNFYRVLGVTAIVGRTIVPEDDQPSAPAVAMISDKYWRSRFASDPNVAGKNILINNVPVTIVGVIEPGFTGVQRAIPGADPPEVSVPLALEDRLNPNNVAGAGRLRQATAWWLQVMGRVKPGVSAMQVQGNLEGMFQPAARAGLDSYLASLPDDQRSTSRNRNRTNVPVLRIDAGNRGVYDVGDNEVRAVAILSGVVALVLLIVCANVANLLLARATSRQKEISVRLSLGATRARLIRQLLTESILLASVGGGLGVLMAYWLQPVLPGAGNVLPGAPGQSLPLDWRVLSFVLGVTGLTGIVFGLAPALRATRTDVGVTLKESSRTVAGSRNALSQALLVVQVAVSLVLLVGAGLFLRTVQNLRHVDVGFNAQNLVLFRVNPQLNRYDEKRVPMLYRDLLDRLRAVPGVREAGLSQPALLTGNVNGTDFFVQGRSYPDRSANSINRLVVSPNFFALMSIPVLTGRGFTDAENNATAPKVAAINDAAARKFFPNENPLGRRFGASPETSGQIEIVGIVRDTKYDGVREAAPPTMFVPHLQARMFGPTFTLRTAGDPLAAVGAIREAVRQIDPNLPMADVSTQMEQVEQRFLQEKVFAQAYALFGGLALLLAAIGLFGLMSYSVARRTNEIGIRMALGAQARDVLRLIMRESMVLVIAGVAIGLGIALAAGRLVASLLYGVAATDTVTMLVAMTVMIAVSAIAGFLPARRASRVDPLVALHYE